MPARSRAPKQEEAVKETTVVICGEEKEWLERFARCLREKAQPRLNVQLFADADELRRYLAEHRAELAVVPEETAAEFEPACPVLYFTEEERPGDERAMYRYRPVSRHIAQIMGTVGQAAEENGPLRADVLAVYSPVRGAGTTAASVLLGMILAEKEPTVLLCTERYSVLPALLPREREGTLAELLYYAKVKGDPAAHLPELEEREGNLVWICPAAEPEDLRSASEEDWTALILAVRASGRYRHVVIDAGDGAADEVWLLEAADRIFMPTRQGGIAIHRERAFRTRLEHEGREDLLERTLRFSFPETEEVRDLLDYRQLLYTQWGRTLRRLLRGEA